MFTPSTWYTISKELADLWGELEDEASLKQTENLIKNYDRGTTEWYKEQLKQIPSFQKTISNLAKGKLNQINKVSAEAIRKAIELVDIETIKSIKTLTGLDSDVNDTRDEFVATAVKKVTDFNKGQINAFAKATAIKNNQLVNSINVVSNAELKKVASFNAEERTNILFDAIKRQTEIGINQGVPVAYSNGRIMPFKSYMEMAIRTTIQNEASDRMEQASSNLGVIFYLASEHADCADDHADFQGKLYVNEKWESIVKDEDLKERVRKFIQEKDIKTIQWVRGAPVWFTTRPNCRHFLIPITIEQAMGNLSDLKSRLRTKRGTYKKDNYDDLKVQRYNERNIRFYKNRAENNKVLHGNTNDPMLKIKLENDITRDSKLVRDWQAKQRELLKSNPNLKREYRRESANKMAQDLGVSLRLKKNI